MNATSFKTLAGAGFTSRPFGASPRLSSDHAENSIMQTITIAVSAILIAAGLVTAPGLINNARDNNAKTDLANLAYAQEATVAESGTYFVYDSHPGSEHADIPSDLVNVTSSGDVRTIVLADSNAWVGFSKSPSGKIFIRSSASAETREASQADLTAEGVVFAPLAGTQTQLFAGVDVPAVFPRSVLRDAAQAVVDEEAFDFGGDGAPGEVEEPTGGDFVCYYTWTVWNEMWEFDEQFESDTAYNAGYLLGRTHLDGGTNFAPGTLDPRYDSRCWNEYLDGYADAFYDEGFEVSQLIGGSSTPATFPNACVAYNTSILGGEPRLNYTTAADQGSGDAFTVASMGSMFEWASYETLSTQPMTGNLDGKDYTFPESCRSFWQLGYDEQVALGV